jgi:acyl-CoA hydrolase
MQLIDLCGGIAAVRHGRRPVVTASVGYISFLHPVRIGQLLILRSSVNRVFKSSMEVGVKVWVEDANTGDVHHTSSAYITFVAIDENGRPVSVAPALPETEDEKRRFEEAGRRRENRLNQAFPIPDRPMPQS